MIGRGFLRGKAAEDSDPQGFDAYDLRLGDLMRGERATMGKSLIDVQRELKIKAAYIAAIENADPSAFDTPGFIAGYVRSYARYLNMDPDWAFETFCRESGFTTAHGMSVAASPARAQREDKAPVTALGRDIFAGQGTPFLPASPSVLSSVEPRAVGSVLVLVALLSGLSYGGWTVMREIQKVTLAPVEQPPTVVAEVDPLAGGARPDGEGERFASIEVPSAEALDRLYRPEALEVPVLVPRDGPIAALDPATVGTLPAPGAEAAPQAPVAVAQAAPVQGPPPPGAVDGVEQALAAALGADADGVLVTTGPAPRVELVAVRDAWVRVNAPDGSVLFEGILGPGDTFEVPATEEPSKLRVGESGALFMAVNGVPFGPVGPAGQVTKDVALSPEAITTTYAQADLSQEEELADYVAVASAEGADPADLPAGAVLPGDAPSQ
ncbi:helix-turn-helix domain-containing protein [Rubellimicrobium aerolatum]|uniref:Helix-turn-helix domain-containing protein n=1 Tax=Rubellimicrobium aerolatum TaxID=490979 RepID=A0ABW0SBX4_9RHOB|nr:helix-turn-helix domain-containing protein [Rubellimicrobium aerolatum]MBP1805955.1 cytoskeletal protein RodZ [Rubellimicrobium aerolatum]